jgi:hypothetical protein
MDSSNDGKVVYHAVSWALAVEAGGGAEAVYNLFVPLTTHLCTSSSAASDTELS